MSSFSLANRTKNPIKLVGIIFMVLGSTFLIVGGVLFASMFSLVQNGEHTDAIVVDLVLSRNDEGSTMYAPVVQYSCGGKEVIKESGISSSIPYSVGDHAFVYCDPSDPTRFVMDVFFDKYFGVFFMLPWFIFFSIGLGMLIYGRLRKKKIARLKASGYTVDGMVVLLRVISDANALRKGLTTGGGSNRSLQSPYTEITVAFSHPMTGQKIDAVAEPVYGDITSSIKMGDKLTVYVSQTDPKEYWVDVERFNR